MLEQQLINGLMLGASYAMVAIGYTLIFGVLRLLHFAHGEVFMLGAFFGLQIVIYMTGVEVVAAAIMAIESFLDVKGILLFFAIFGAMIGTGIIGALVVFVAVRPVDNKFPLAPLISTIGVTILIQNVTIMVFGGTLRSFPASIEPVRYQIGDLTIDSVQIFILVTAFALMGSMWYLIEKTRIGRAIRATSESHETAALLGVNVNFIVLFVFILASCLAGVAGVLDGVKNSNVSPFMGLEVAVKALVCMLLGGLGNIVGALVAGFLLGTVEILSSAYLGSGLRDFLTFSILITILLFKPTGLFGTRVVRD